MTRFSATALHLAVGALVALAATAVVHHALRPGVVLVVAVLAAAVAAVARPAWSQLPRFVSQWLDVGVVVVTALVGVEVHGLSFGLAYAVLRAAELAALGGAAGLLGVGMAGLAYTHNRLAREVRAHQQRADALEQRALESRLTALTAQIHPHFLFNTLNTLAELIHEDEDEAEELVTDLAAIMRYALRSSVTRVPLADELEVVRRLLRIEQARLGGRLRWSVDPAVEGVTLPGMLLQPLVENAVQHGAASRPEGGEVRVAVQRTEDRVRIEVFDDGPGLPDEVARELVGGPQAVRGTGGAGGGLRNTAERVRLTWPDGSGRLTCDQGAGGTRLVLDIPVEDA